MTMQDTSTFTPSATVLSMRDEIVKQLHEWAATPDGYAKLNPIYVTVVHGVTGVTVNTATAPETETKTKTKGNGKKRFPNLWRAEIMQTIRQDTTHNNRMTITEICAAMRANGSKLLMRDDVLNEDKIRKVISQNSRYFDYNKDGTISVRRG